MTWAYLITHKSHVCDLFKDFYMMVQTQFKTIITIDVGIGLASNGLVGCGRNRGDRGRMSPYRRFLLGEE
jgi:hypothetical protein